jgi:hypothetical protein
MNHLFNLLVVALILLNVTALTLLARPLTRLPYGLAQAAVVLALCLGCFFVEHYVGLGRMGFLLPLGGLASAWIAWRQRSVLRANLGANLALLAGFFYCLAWRYLTPNIDASTERMADLSFVTAYWQGVRLPPPDLWFPPYKLNHYYSFQHYAAGLLGRFAGLGPGVSYHMAYCLLTGLTMSAAYEAVRILCARRWARALILAVFLAGGTGASIFTPFMIKNARTDETAWCSMRFVGTTTAFPDDKLTKFGRLIKSLAPKTERPEQIQELPMETFSYVVELGDYHAPLGGSYMLAISLGAAALLVTRRRELRAPDAPPRLPGAPEPPEPEPGQIRAAHALLAATLPLTLATNTWTLPFQGMLAVGCLFYAWLERGARPDWMALFGGAAGVTLALYPFFSYFLPLTVGNNAPLTLTSSALRTPMPFFLMVFWPVLAVCLLHFVYSLWAQRERALLSFFWLLALMAADLVYMDDIYGGSAERFNSTLKWWPWVFNGALLVVAAMNLDAPWPGWRSWGDSVRTLNPRRPDKSAWGLAWQRAMSGSVLVGTTLVLLLVLTYTVRLGWSWADGYAAHQTVVRENQKRLARGAVREVVPTSFGQLDGAAWLRGNAFYSMDVNRGVSSMLTFLKMQKHGVLMEKPDERAFAQVGAFSLFTGLPSIIGWTSHENLWRNDQTDIEVRYNKTNDLYAGTLAEPLRFLDAHQVRFILWLPRNNKPDAPDAQARLNATLSPKYDWNEFCRVGNDVVGVWVRR